MSSPRIPMRGLDRVVLIFTCAVLLPTLGYPLFALGLAFFQVTDHADYLTLATWRTVGNTLLLGLASVLGSGLVGSALALFLARYRFVGRDWLATAAYLPLTLPPLVGTLAFYYLIGRDGVFSRIAQSRLGVDLLMPPFVAVLVVHVYSFYVFFYALVLSARESLDETLSEAARTLGATRAQVFYRVTLPLLRPALKNAAVLTFMASCASFSAPYFFGQGFTVLSVRIYEAREQFHEEAAVVYTVLLAALSLSSLWLVRRHGAYTVAGRKGTPRALRAGPARFLASVAAYFLTVLLLLPHFALLWLSLTDYRAWQTGLVPTQFTWQNYIQLFSRREVLQPFVNSLWMSALGAGAALVVGTAVGYLYGRRRPGGALVHAFVMIPWALPGSVLAVNLITAFNTAYFSLYTTVWLLPMAYFLREVPLMTRVATAAIQTFDVSLIEAARVLGASPWRAVVRVALPLLAPALLAGFSLCFTSALGEFVASILLFQPSNIPVSVRMYMDWRGDVGLSAAQGVLLVVLMGAALFVARRSRDLTLPTG